MPKISFIITALNDISNLERCLNSVIELTKCDFEIIVSVNYYTNFKTFDSDPRVKVISCTIQDVFAARNDALDIATGEYIFFLEPDAYLLCDIATTATFFADRSADIVFFQSNTINSDGMSQMSQYQTGYYALGETDARQDFIFNYLLKYKFGTSLKEFIIRRDLIKTHNLKFEAFDNSLSEKLFLLCCSSIANAAVSLNTLALAFPTSEKTFFASSVKYADILTNKIHDFLANSTPQSDILNLLPVIWYMLIDEAFTLSNLKSATLKQRREACLTQAYNPKLWKTQAKKLSTFTPVLENLYGVHEAADIINNVLFLANGNSMTYSMRSKHIAKDFEQLNRPTPNEAKLIKMYDDFAKKDQRIYFLGVEEFGNLGDLQINAGVRNFLKEQFGSSAILERSFFEVHSERDLLAQYITDDDIIVFSGGGNLGDQYPGSENLRVEIIEQFPKNKKIIFPQTAFYGTTPQSDEVLTRAKSAYSKNKNVTLCLREKTSYDFAKENFDCKCLLIPDIVLSVNMQQKNIVRKNQVLFSMRHDIERTISDTAQNQLENALEKITDNKVFYDTQLPFHTKPAIQKFWLNDIFNEYSSSKIIITDRLHGMVFAALTGTPCIAFSNYNHKVVETYDWISNLPYIKFASSVDEAIGLIPSLIAQGPGDFDNSHLQPYFDKLANALKN